MTGQHGYEVEFVDEPGQGRADRPPQAPQAPQQDQAAQTLQAPQAPQASQLVQTPQTSQADQPPQAPQADQPTPDVHRSVGAAVAWVGAAVLSAVATFQSVFTYRFTGVSIRSQGGYDAWGHSLDAQLSDEHGPRYALLFWVCVVVFALLAAGLLRAASVGRVGQWAERHAGPVGLCATTLLVGTLAGVGLGIEAEFSSYRALSTSLHDTHGGVDLTIGACLWFGLGSLACAIVAQVLQLRDRGAAVLPHSAS